VATLHRELTLQNGDPGPMTELGEALSMLAGGEDEARTIPGSLAARDWVASLQGYKALAALRLRQGDEAGQKRAMKRAMKRCESSGTAL
jgi:hypothetical protein